MITHKKIVTVRKASPVLIKKDRPKFAAEPTEKKPKKLNKRTPISQKNLEMQILDGNKKGTILKSTTSPKVRPTARRVREIVFALIGKRIKFARFLDLCAGSGTVGIEAVSRGALLSTFVERSAKMCSFIKQNMEQCQIKEGHGEVFELEAVPFLKKMEKRKRNWDIVYFDPPYQADYDEVIAFFAKGACLKDRGTLIVEHHAEMFFPENIGRLKRWRVVVLGETAISLFEERDPNRPERPPRPPRREFDNRRTDQRRNAPRNPSDRKPNNFSGKPSFSRPDNRERTESQIRFDNREKLAKETRNETNRFPPRNVTTKSTFNKPKK